MPIYNPPTTPDDGQKGGQAHQRVRLSNTSRQPPGAGIIGLPTLDHSPQAEHCISRLTAGHHHDYSTREPSPLSFDSLSDESETSISAWSAPSHSNSPVPRASHTFKTRLPLPQRNQRHSSTSYSTPDTQKDQFWGRSSARSRIPSQQRAPPPAVQGNRGGHLPYAGVHQSNPAVPGPESEPAQPVAFSASPITRPLQVTAQNTQLGFGFRTQQLIETQQLHPNAYSPYPKWSSPPPVSSSVQYPVPGLVPTIPTPGLSSHTHRGSVASIPDVDPPSLPSSPGFHDDFANNASPHLGPASSAAPSQIASHALPQQGTQPIPSAYLPYNEYFGSSPATSGVQYPATGPAYMVPGPSSHIHRGSVTSLPAVDPLPSPSSSSLKTEWYGDDGDDSLHFGSASDGAPSRLEGHDLSQQGTSSAEPEAPQRRRRDGKRKRKDDPKDPEATERLRNRRQNDEYCQEELYKLFVPMSEGNVPKKDRLPLILRHARNFMGIHNSVQKVTNMEHGMDDRPGGPSTSQS